MRAASDNYSEKTECAQFSFKSFNIYDENRLQLISLPESGSRRMISYVNDSIKGQQMDMVILLEPHRLGPCSYDWLIIISFCTKQNTPPQNEITIF